jgi:Predicted metal-binding protein
MLDAMHDSIFDAGVYEFGFVNPADIEYRQMIRDICADNSCHQYGRTWACPPAIGTVAECRERCLQYNNMLVFTGLFFIEDSYDFEGMKKSMHDFKGIAERLDVALSPYLKSYQVLSNESCNRCHQCTYPDAPCRFPEKLHHSIEGYGILVSELAQKAGVKYNNGEGTVTFFGAVLYDLEL